MKHINWKVQETRYLFIEVNLAFEKVFTLLSRFRPEVLGSLVTYGRFSQTAKRAYDPNEWILHLLFCILVLRYDYFVVGDNIQSGQFPLVE